MSVLVMSGLPPSTTKVRVTSPRQETKSMLQRLLQNASGDQECGGISQKRSMETSR